jgi:hypothetical protein
MTDIIVHCKIQNLQTFLLPSLRIGSNLAVGTLCLSQGIPYIKSKFLILALSLLWISHKGPAPVTTSMSIQGLVLSLSQLVGLRQ